MKIVIDTNVVMAMLIRPGIPLSLFFRSKLHIFAPGLLLIELENNKELLAKKTSLDETEIDNMIELLHANITFVHEENFLGMRRRATDVCPDVKDVVYFALALHLDCPIWSNEKKLKEQDIIDVYATHELIKLLKLNS